MYPIFRRAKLKGLDIRRSKDHKLDPVYEDDDSFEVFYTLIPNMLTLAAFAVCVHVLANKGTLSYDNQNANRSIRNPADFCLAKDERG